MKLLEKWNFPCDLELSLKRSNNSIGSTLGVDAVVFVKVF